MSHRTDEQTDRQHVPHRMSMTLVKSKMYTSKYVYLIKKQVLHLTLGLHNARMSRNTVHSTLITTSVIILRNY